jgi:hypothetical protein
MKVQETEENMIIDIENKNKNTINQIDSTHIKDLFWAGENRLNEIKQISNLYFNLLGPKEVSFESGVRQPCCAPKGKCVIF